MSIAAHIVNVAKRNKSIALRKGPNGRWLTCCKAVSARHELVRKLWAACGDAEQVASLIGLHPDQVTRILFKRTGAVGTRRGT